MVDTRDCFPERGKCLNLRFKVGREEVKSKEKGALSRENDTYNPEGKRRHMPWREVESSSETLRGLVSQGWACHFNLYTWSVSSQLRIPVEML